MTTIALDLVTVMHAMRAMAQKMGHNAGWVAFTSEQDIFVHLYEEWEEHLESLGDLEALASEHYELLNQFLVEHGFEAKIVPFDPDRGLGVVSILDKIVRWKSGPGILIDIDTADGIKPGFSLSGQDVCVYVAGDKGHLLRIETQSEDTLWFFVPHNSRFNDLEGLDLVDLAFDVMGSLSSYRMTSEYAGVQVPMVDFEVEPDVSFLLGMDVSSDLRSLIVTDAGQEFRFRMDQTGARVKVETHMVALECCIMSTPEFVIDRPFFGWFTHRGSEGLPIAVFFVDYDSMIQPAGSLEDL